MSDYKITKYTQQKADKLGVIIKPSTNKNKKLDVFDKNNKKITSIGHSSYSDYPNYIETHGEDYAKKRRLLYLQRHKNDKNKAGIYARLLLW